MKGSDVLMERTKGVRDLGFFLATVTDIQWFISNTGH